MRSGEGTFHSISDNVHDVIRLSDLEYQIATGPLFGRLHFVNQHSTAFYTWPSLRDQRYEHSVGTMHIAGQMFYYALLNSSTDVIHMMCVTCRKSLHDVLVTDMTAQLNLPVANETNLLFLKRWMVFVNDCCDMSPQNKLSEMDLALRAYDFMVPACVNGADKLICLYLAQGIRLAGMLHDLGHPPMSHVCEAALKELREKISKSGADKAAETSEFTAAFDDYYGRQQGRGALHEIIGNTLSSAVVGRAADELAQQSTDQMLQDFLGVSAIVAELILFDYPPFDSLHSIVSGVIDADRLDYIQRESLDANLGGSALQYGRIIQSVRLVEVNNQRYNYSSFAFAFPLRIQSTAEEFLRKRVTNYRVLISHHAVVKSELLLKSIIISLAYRYFKDVRATKLGRQDAEESYDNGLVSAGAYELPDDISGLWKPLTVDWEDADRLTLSFGQWNDPWLLALLKREYTKLEMTKSQGSDAVLYSQLGEFFSFGTHYATLFRRSSDCAQFRQALMDLVKKDENYRLFIRVGQEHIRYIFSDNPSDIKEGKFRKAIFNLATCTNLADISWCLKDCYDTANKVDLDTTIDECFRKALGDVLVKNGLLTREFENDGHLLISRNSINPGVGGKDKAYFFRESDGEVEELTQFSDIETELRAETRKLPVFYAYLLTLDGRPTKEVEAIARSKDFGEKLAKELLDPLVEMVKRHIKSK